MISISLQDKFSLVKFVRAIYQYFQIVYLYQMVGVVNLVAVVGAK